MDESTVPEAWRVLRIQAELVEGIETLAELASGVTVFGGARFAENSKFCQQAEQFGRLLGNEGIPVITGGGPGIMEAANKGCFSTPTKSVGMNISLPIEQEPNPYQDISLQFRYFFVRKFLLVKQALGFVIFPGGFGTLDELFEAITLVQTHKTSPFPIVLVGKGYWSGLIDWIKETMLTEGCISGEELSFFTLVDTPEEAAKIILTHARNIKAQTI